MRHNFPAIEALEAGGIDPSALARVAPAVDPEHLLVREARPWFERIVLRSAAAIALPYVVYMRASVYTRPRRQLTGLVIHELVHVNQWRREGYVRFALVYLGEYLRGRWRGQPHDEAYRAISYEVEARRLAETLLTG
jgi:hypothetical protein